MGAHASLGIVAGCVAAFAIAVYIWSMFRSTTRPNRATWWIWTLCGFLIAVSYDASGADETRWIPWVYFFGPLIAAILSIRYGEGGWTRLDVLCLAGAAVSVVLWLVFHTPRVVLCLNIVMDFLGLAPTLAKSWRDPRSESRASWTLALVANALNATAIKEWEFAIALHPAYMIAATGAVTLLLWRPRKAAS